MWRRKRILVTGGAGFIGSHLTDTLLFRGHSVTVLDNLRNGSKKNLKEAFSNSKFKFIQGDVLDRKTCRRSVKNTDIVFHLACLGVRHSLHSPVENHRVNAEGTLNMLEAACPMKARFFYVSTSEVYGNTSQFPITEKAPTHPTTVYGAGKLSGEIDTNVYHVQQGLKTTVLRLFNNYGPRAHYEGDAGEMIPRAIVSILYGRSPVLFGDGSNTRDFFYVKDTARAFLALLDLPGLEGKTLNIGTGVEISMKRLVDKILLLIGESKMRPKRLAPRPGDLPRLWVDAKKFYTLTRFRPAYSFEEGLKETIGYYRERMHSENLMSNLEAVNWKK